MTVTLYDAALSPFAQKVKMALLEKGIPYDHQKPDLAAPTEAFLAASPRREVPALVDGDISVFDATIIIEYLEDRWPDPSLFPGSPADRAQVRMIDEICDSQFEAVIFGITEIIAFKRATGELAEHILSNGRTDIARLTRWLDRQLGDREWFSGDQFGFGDIAVLPYLQTATLYKLGPTAGTKIADWFARASARPSFQQCIADAKAEVAEFKESQQKIRSGRWPRQYRDHRLDWFIRSGGAEIVQAGLADGTIRLSTLEA